MKLYQIIFHDNGRLSFKVQGILAYLKHIHNVYYKLSNAVPILLVFSGNDHIDSQTIDKIFHAFVYLCLVLWFSGQYKISFTFFLVITLYGVLIEFIQYFLPYRSAELMDIFSNQIGVIVGIIFSMSGLCGWSKKFENYFF